MQEIDLAEFEWKLRVRPLQLADFPAVVELQKLSFPDMQPWSQKQFESQLEQFPEGQIGIECDERLVASSSSLILSYDEQTEWHNYKKLSDSGYIRNHVPDGDTLYGIEIMVDPEYRGMRLSRRLYDERKELCRHKNLARIMIGGRIPGFHQHADAMTAREYIERVMDKSLYDPVLTAQLANGFALQGLIPNYLPSDHASRGYATFLEWKNLDYQSGLRKRYQRNFEPVRIGAVQYQMRPVADFDEFARQAEYFVDVAGDYKCDFLLFPELFTTQLLSCIPPERPGQAARKLATFTPRYLEFFTEVAVKYDTNIIGGSQFVVEDDTLLNVSFLFGRDGSIHRQSKLHITPSERRWWGVSGGDRFDVFDTDCGKVSLQICYDVEFPELGRMAAAMGANIIFVPFNTDSRAGYLRVRSCAAARCIENHMFAAIAGCTGNLPFVENADVHYAQTAILTPSDVMFARDGISGEANPNIETVIIQDVDLELLRRHRSTGSVQNWRDRRTDFYRLSYRIDGDWRQA